MARRLFRNDRPTITFTKDFRQLVHGNLEPGKAVMIVYDAERLPNERSTDGGQKAWAIQAFYKFTEEGEVHTTDLWSETGEILTKVSDELGEGTMMLCSIDLPVDADHLTLWFLNTGKSGAHFWDSNFGRNYIFRFVANDFHITSVRVDRDTLKSISWFELQIVAQQEIYDLTAAYRITNDSAQANTELHLALTPSSSVNSEGLRPWAGRAPVPENAVVQFTITYNVYGNPHRDTNSGKGYLTWPGAVRNIEAAVL
jgi:hypothetical protein